jgi:hypothetical protein
LEAKAEPAFRFYHEVCREDIPRRTFALARSWTTCNYVSSCALTVMATAVEEKAFLRSAIAAIPRIAEIVCEFPPDDRAGALEAAEGRFMGAALDFGCTEIAAQSRVSAVMGRLRRRVEERRTREMKLRSLLHRLTEPQSD